MRPRNQDRPLARHRQNSGDINHVLRLETKIQLFGDGLGEDLHENRRIRQSRYRNSPHKPGSHPGHGGNILPHPLRDLWPLHFDDHLFAGHKPSHVNLRDGCSGQRHALEFGENRIQGLSEFQFNDSADLIKGHCGHPIAAPFELVHKFFGKEPPAGRNDLAELDIGRAEPFEGSSQSAGKSLPGSWTRVAALPESPAKQCTPHARGSGQKTQDRGPATRGHPLGHLGPLGLTQGLQTPIPLEILESKLPWPALAKGPPSPLGLLGPRISARHGRFLRVVRFQIHPFSPPIRVPISNRETESAACGHNPTPKRPFHPGQRA